MNQFRCFFFFSKWFCSRDGLFLYKNQFLCSFFFAPRTQKSTRTFGSTIFDQSILMRSMLVTEYFLFVLIPLFIVFASYPFFFSFLSLILLLFAHCSTWKNLNAPLGLVWASKFQKNLGKIIFDFFITGNLSTVNLPFTRNYDVDFIRNY